MDERTQSELKSLHSLAEKENWGADMIIPMKHSLIMNGYLRSIIFNKKPIYQDAVSYLGISERRRRDYFIRKSETGELIIKDYGVFSIFAMECFSRGMLCLADQIEAMSTSEDITTGLQLEKHNKLVTQLRDRIDDLMNAFNKQHDLWTKDKSTIFHLEKILQSYRNRKLSDVSNKKTLRKPIGEAPLIKAIRMVKLKNGRRNVSQIAKIVGRDPGTVKSQAKHYGIKLNDE